MDRSVLIAGKEYPDGRDFAIAAVRHQRNAVISVAEMPEGLDEGRISEGIYPAKWTRNSPLSARSLILQAENQCGTFQDVVVVFDTNWYSGNFEDLSPEMCSKAIDIMISSYTYLVSELLARLKKKGGGTLVFVLKKNSAEDSSGGGFTKKNSILAGMAEGAFRGLGETIATNFAEDESLRIVLTKADLGTADSQFANWLFEILDAPNSLVGKYDPKKGPQWYKMGTKTTKGGLFNPFQKK